MCSMSVLPGEPVQDEQDRPDDEQHESDDAQQLVQLGALLQERRKEAFKGGHTSGRLRLRLRSRERRGRVHQAERLPVFLHRLGELGVLLFLLRFDLALRVVAVGDVLHEQRKLWPD